MLAFAVREAGEASRGGGEVCTIYGEAEDDDGYQSLDNAQQQDESEPHFGRFVGDLRKGGKEMGLWGLWLDSSTAFTIEFRWPVGTWGRCKGLNT